MGNSLCIGRNAVVLLCSEMNHSGVEASQNGLDLLEALITRTVLDQDQRLSSGVDAWAVKRMAADDFDILGKMFLKCCNLRSFARCLSSDDGSLLRS